MKNSLFFTPFMLGAAAFIWMGVSGGVAQIQMQDRTGSPVSSTACNMCHAGSAFNVTAEMQLIDQGGAQVSVYQPNTKYTLRATIDAPNATRYGFQITGLDGSNQNMGAWNALTNGTQVISLNGLSYFEQTSALATNTFEMEWTAPAAGSGTVTFYGSALAANGNGGTGGDAHEFFNDLMITEDVTSSIASVTKADVRVFPNPSIEWVQVESTELIQQVRILNTQGREVYRDAFQNSPINVSGFARGMYFMELTMDGTTQQTVFMKL